MNYPSSKRDVLLNIAWWPDEQQVDYPVRDA
jgi:hypothetical protein